MIAEEKTRPTCPQCKKEIALSRSVVAEYAGDPQAGDFWGKNMRLICQTDKWVHFETNGEHRIARLKKPAKARASETERKYVVFPAGADKYLPLPAGQWKRLEDGQIEAHVSYEDLENVKALRDVVAGVDVRRDVALPVDHHNETLLKDLPAFDEYLDELFGEDDSDLDDIFNELLAE